MITKFLFGLTLPISLPPLTGEQKLADPVHGDPVERGLFAAYRALPDLPMEDDVRDRLREMILDWIAGREWIFFAFIEEEKAALDGAELQVRRLSRNIELVRQAIWPDKTR